MTNNNKYNLNDEVAGSMFEEICEKKVVEQQEEAEKAAANEEFMEKLAARAFFDEKIRPHMEILEDMQLQIRVAESNFKISKKQAAQISKIKTDLLGLFFVKEGDGIEEELDVLRTLWHEIAKEVMK
jgi:hypothetical protein